MKKTLVALMVMVLGLPVAAVALPVLSLDDPCPLVTALIGGEDPGELENFMDIVDDALDATITDFERVVYEDTNPDPEVTDMNWVFKTDGVPDMAKLALLGAATCADPDLAEDFAANKATFLSGFVVALDALVTWGTAVDGEEGEVNDAQDAILGCGVAVEEMFAITGVADGLSGFLDLLFSDPDYEDYAAYRPLIMAMCLDSGLTVLLSDDDEDGEYDEGDDLPAYLPVLCPIVAGLIEDDIGGGDEGGAPVFAFGMRYFLSNVMPGLLSLSTVERERLIDYADGTLLEDFRGFAEQFGQFALIAGQILPGYVGYLATYVDPAFAAYLTPFVAAGTAFGTGKARIDAIQLPNLPILGVAKGLTEPFSNGGDYDGDTVTNLETYNAVEDSGNDMAYFISAVSGGMPFYEGNPLLPAAGIIGLAALVSAITAGGAFVLRKK